MAQITVSIRELKPRLEHYLRRVKRGDVLVITQRGKTVARIVPVTLSAQARARELVKARLVNWNGRRLPPIKPVARARGARTVSDLVLENRE